MKIMWSLRRISLWPLKLWASQIEQLMESQRAKCGRCGDEGVDVQPKLEIDARHAHEAEIGLNHHGRVIGD